MKFIQKYVFSHLNLQVIFFCSFGSLLSTYSSPPSPFKVQWSRLKQSSNETSFLQSSRHTFVLGLVILKMHGGYSSRSPAEIQELRSKTVNVLHLSFLPTLKERILSIHDCFPLLHLSIYPFLLFSHFLLFLLSSSVHLLIFFVHLIS